MKKDQKIVAIGAASGVILMVVGVAALTYAFSAPMIANSLSARLAYALGANVFAILPLFVMLAAVGNARFMSKAIDPTRHAESHSMQIDGRVADNTLQQNFVFLVATLALSTVVPADNLQIIWASAIVFVAARCIFWIGYRIHPLYRALGMAATSYLNLVIIICVLYHLAA